MTVDSDEPMAGELSEKVAVAGGNSGRASSHGNSTEETTTPQTENQPGDAALEKADSRVPPPPYEAGDDDPYRHLPPHQADLLRSQITLPELKAGFGTLYRYASRNDLMIMAVCTVCAIAAGAALPLMTVIFGNLQGTFEDYFDGEGSYSAFESKISHLVLYFIYLAIGEYITTYIATVGFIYTGEHISAKIREHYLQSCLKQNIGFFDKLGAGEVTTRITAEKKSSPLLTTRDSKLLSVEDRRVRPTTTKERD